MTLYRLSPEAEQDLEDIRTYLMEQDGVRLVRHVMGKIRQAMHFLARTPGAGHLRQDLTDEPVKFWPVFSYLIVYDPVARPIGIVRVLHGAQDLETTFRLSQPRL